MVRIVSSNASECCASRMRCSPLGPRSPESQYFTVRSLAPVQRIAVLMAWCVGPSSIPQPICHEVHRPGHVWRIWHRQGIGLVPLQSPARFDPQVQFQLAVNPIDALVVPRMSVTTFNDLLNVMGTTSKSDLEDRNVLFMDDGGPTYLGKLLTKALA